MEWLNYHHLLYFWLVAREGGLAPAGALLRLSAPTLSGQIRKLEERLGDRLFVRRGRKLALTEVGRVVYRYADEIFGLGNELLDTLRLGVAGGHTLRLTVGIVDAVPKMLVRRLLEPALTSGEQIHLVCREGHLDRLLAELALHELDVVIADAPAAGGAVRAYNHELGESAIVVMGTKALAAGRRRRFPASLDGAPMILPLPGSPLRRAADGWLLGLGVTPRIVAEVEDGALLKAFARDGMGLVLVPAVIVPEVRRAYGLVVVGEIATLRERFYAISAERKIVHPAVRAIREAARAELFGAR